MKNKDILLFQSSCSFSSAPLLIRFNLKPLRLRPRKLFAEVIALFSLNLIHSLDSTVGFYSSSDVLQNCQILDFSSPSRNFFFCRSRCTPLLVLFFFMFVFAFQLFVPTSQILHPRATLGKGFGYMVNHYQYHQSVLRCLRNTWHLPSGGCHVLSRPVASNLELVRPGSGCGFGPEVGVASYHKNVIQYS